MLGASLGAMLTGRFGTEVGSIHNAGLKLGLSLGTVLRASDGTVEGATEDCCDGESDGTVEGLSDGTLEGASDGARLGKSLASGPRLARTSPEIVPDGVSEG